jgi:hypothetical protein
MQGKVKLNMAQRQMLARVFNDELRNNKIHGQLGPTGKAFYGEAIRLYFMPIKSGELPGFPVESREIKDDEGNLVDTEYKFTVVVNFNQVGDGTTLSLTKPIDKSFIDNVY